MKRFMLLTFVFLGWSYWELSGGSEFEPRSPEVAESVAPEADRKTAQSTAARAPVQVPVKAPKAPKPARVSAADTGKSEVIKIRAVPSPATADSLENPEITLISLEQSPDQVAQPLSQLNQGGVLQAPAIGPSATPTADAPRSIAANRVNMRAGPGTNHEVLIRLSRGTPVEVLSDSGDGWLRLRAQGSDQIGWIAADLVSP